MPRPPPRSTLFPYTTLFRSAVDDIGWKPLGPLQSEEEMPLDTLKRAAETCRALVTINPLVKRGIAVRTSYIWGKGVKIGEPNAAWRTPSVNRDRKSTRLNSSHVRISYAVFCLKKKIIAPHR